MNSLGLFINAALRISIFYFLFEVLLNPNDPRFAGKAIPIRNFIIVISLSFLFPLIYYLKKKRPNLLKIEKIKNFGKYPFWADNLYLTIFVLDMAGNSFNLYDRFFYFDLIPHFHAPGVVTIISMFFGFSFISALGLSNLIHTVLEAQEFYTDVLLKTHNVRGLFDTVNDLAVGIIGGIIYPVVYIVIKKIKFK